MPRSPEWVQPKEYSRFKWKMKFPDREKNDDRETKPPKAKKSRQEEQKGAEKERQKELKEEQDPGKGKKGKQPPRQRQPKDDQPTGGRQPSKEVDRVSDDRGVDAKRPGSDVEWREPDWDPGRRYAWAERIYPPGIEGRRALPPAPPRALPGPRGTPLPGGAERRTLPAGTPAEIMEARQAALADLVRETMDRQAALGPGKERSANGLTIHTGEVLEDLHQRSLGSDGRGSKALGGGVPESPTTTTKPIRAIRPGSWDAQTGPIPKIQTDNTQPLRPSRRGDTASFEPISGKVIHPEKPKTGPDFVNTRQFPVIKGELHRDATPLSDRPTPRLGLTQRAEPFGQMSLFDVPAGSRGEGGLAQAQSERTNKMNTGGFTPLGRQMQQGKLF